MNPLIRKLIVKDLYLNRWFIAVAIVAGLVSLGIATTGRIGFNVGALCWMTVIVALGVLLPMYGVVNERKERSLLFVLSLPISGVDYVRAKLFGLMLCFLLPWLVLSAGAVGLIVVSDAIPDGLLPFASLLCGFLLVNFGFVLVGALLTRSEAVMGAIIIGTNMAVTLYFFLLGGLPQINAHLSGPHPVWNGTVWLIFSIQACVLIATLALCLLVSRYRRAFI